MEEFVQEIQSYANAMGIKPGTVLKKAGYSSGAVFRKWATGAAECNVSTMEKIYAHMAANPPQNSAQTNTPTHSPASN